MQAWDVDQGLEARQLRQELVAYSEREQKNDTWRSQ